MIGMWEGRPLWSPFLYGMKSSMRNRQIITASALILMGVAFVALCYWLSAIVLPLFLAFIIAYILAPLVAWAEAKGVKRSIAVLGMFALISLIAGGISWFFLGSLSREFQAIQAALPDYASRLYSLIPQQVKVYLDIETPEKVYSHINTALATLRELPMGVYRDTFLVVQKAFATTLSLILTVLGYLIIPVYLYYFLKDLPRMWEGTLDLVPLPWRPWFVARVDEVQDVLAAFIRGQLSVCLILAVLYSIGLSLIGIDLAVMIGTLAGLAFIIPYLGTLIGIVLSVLMALLKFQDLLHPLLCLGWFALVQAFEGSVITPKIVGDKVGLHPLMIMIALLVGGQVAGILGMLLAVPLTAVCNVFGRSMIARYRESDFFAGDP